MKFSIITVSFNSEKTIEKTIQSVINQFGEFETEYIIIDGNSTDSTIKLISNYEEHITCVVSEPDDGIFDAMNKGIQKATGDWIGIINSDDWYAEGALNHVLEISKENDCEIIVGRVVKVDETQSYGKIVIVQPKFSTLIPNNHPATFVKREVYNRIGSFNLSYKIAGDLDFILRAQKENISIYRDKNIYTYMLSGGESSNSIQGVYESFRIANNYGNIIQAFKVLILKLSRIIRTKIITILLSKKKLTNYRKMWWMQDNDLISLK